jgi:hypothetical protein
VKLNEYRLTHDPEKGFSLRTILKRLAFLRMSGEDSLKILDDRRYSYFQLLPSPIGFVEDEDDKHIVYVYVPVDRMRLKLLDVIWFYPFVFWAIFVLIEMALVYPLGVFGGLDIMGWYSGFFPVFAESTSGLLEPNIRNAILVWLPFATVIEILPVFLTYIPSKILLSWGPSWLWNITFGLYLKN